MTDERERLVGYVEDATAASVNASVDPWAKVTSLWLALHFEWLAKYALRLYDAAHDAREEGA